MIINEYYNMLCNGDYPKFIDKYFNTFELNRLKGIGQFCGCDYSKLFNIKTWYSRFDHSVATSLITWNFTKDKVQTLSALFHDLGTPAFSHCVDYLLGDSIIQESSEKEIKDILLNSKDICKLLSEDNISIDDICDVSRYSIIENKSPRLCADRLEGVLHTVYIWLNTWELKKIKDVYTDIVVLNNEDNIPELGFNNIKYAEMFFDAVYEYSIVLQKNEDKYTMQYIADVLKKQIKLRNIKFNDLYEKSEKEIINILKNNEGSWNIFSNASKVNRTNEMPTDVYYVSVESKKRYVEPLCTYNNQYIRLSKISKKVNKLLDEYKSYKDSKYCYIDKIKLDIDII